MSDSERQCIKCEELWPDDTEFFNEGMSCCIACQKEFGLKRYQPNAIFLMPTEKLEKQMQKCRQARKVALEKSNSNQVSLA